jgi:hypothetical protein
MASTMDTDDPPTSMLPIVVLFVVGVSKLFFYQKKWNVRFLTLSSIEALLAFLIQSYLLPMPSIVPWWDLLTKMFSRWVLLVLMPKNIERKASQTTPFYTALLKGPLGPGAFKVVQVIVAIGLLRLFRKEWPSIQFFGISRKYPGRLEWIILVGISVVVNLVLYAWSRMAKSTGAHKGVDRMVSPTKDRRCLTHRERLLYGSLALINATCEEITFRWFWRSEFATYLPNRQVNQNDLRPISFNEIYKHSFGFNANAAQALVFGSLHYYGIPSGLAGVCLTFLYGWIMGILMEHVGDGGLFLPIVAHAIADFYLFSSVARGKATGGNEKPKSSL